MSSRVDRDLYVLHDAPTLARLIGIETPSCSHVVMPATGPSALFAACIDGNPLGSDWLVDLEAPSNRLVSYSGTLASGLFDDEPHTWMRAGHDRFNAFLDEVEPALRHHRRSLCFRPHHRHVVGDVHAAVTLLRERAGGPFEVLLSPADLLAPSMLPCAAEHVERMFAHLGSVAAAVLLTDVAHAENTAETGLFASCRLGEGMLNDALGAGTLARLLDAYVPRATPIILCAGSLENQRVLAGL